MRVEGGRCERRWWTVVAWSGKVATETRVPTLVTTFAWLGGLVRRGWRQSSSPAGWMLSERKTGDWQGLHRTIHDLTLSMSTASTLVLSLFSDGREISQTKSNLRCAIRCIGFSSFSLRPS